MLLAHIIFGFFLLIQPLLAQEDTVGVNAVSQETSVYLVRHAWHAGIVLPRSACDSLLIIRDFPGADYIEIGWGDADFYREARSGVWVTFKAALLPSMSTLHVAAVDQAVAQFFSGRDIIRLTIKTENLTSLLDFINKSFATDEEGGAVRLEPGLYGASYFYKGSEHYYAFRNCNTWVARGLRQAGISISPITTLTVNQLMRKASAYGTVVQESD